MLKQLKIENLALVDKTVLEFDKGMSVLTGETGAGKSVIVNALSLILGERADREYIRFKAEIATVEAIFDVSLLPSEFKAKFEEFIDDNKIIIFREITKTGKSRIKINNISSTLNELKEICIPLAEILGQHSNQLLMNEDNHLDFLDNFASLDNLKKVVSGNFHRWKDLLDELNRLKRKRDQILKERELLLFQKNEIENARITVGEEEELMSEKKILDSARDLISSASHINDFIDGDENSISNLMNLLRKEMDKMAAVDKSLEKQVVEVTDISYRLSDLSGFIEKYGSSINDDPNRLEDINLRLDEIYNLKKKYGGSEQSILNSLTEIDKLLSNTPSDIDSYIDKLERELLEIFAEYSKEALLLSDTRKKAAGYLHKLVIKELSELAIENGGFDFEFIYEDDPHGVIINGRAVKPTANGLESGKILFSANPGEPLKSLVKTASGGEISRILLALKSAEKKNASLNRSLLVFDEVDAGIGGKTALEVGKKLKKLSTNSQLIVITHLHQIAREADHHYLALKTSTVGKRINITVEKLTPDAIEKELERMVALPEEK